jgi:hypothetical protein
VSWDECRICMVSEILLRFVLAFRTWRHERRWEREERKNSTLGRGKEGF